MLNATKRKSCIIMGLGSLCILCSEHIFKNSSIKILGLISADESVIRWGEKNGIRTLFIKNKVKYSDSKFEIDEFIKESNFDYFFSIVNAMFLPEWIIKYPQKYAINFHDSELPKYAGIDATSWVIMLKEENHAVTWHLMSENIDEGDIIKQVIIPIEKAETAFTLNGKSFEAGLSSFKELVEDLSLNRVVLKKQLLENRSYFSRSMPHLTEMSIWNHGVIYWKNSAEDIYALVKSLDYGPDRNALATSKIVIEDSFYIVPHIAICDSKSNTEPGTVIHIDEEAITISTSTNDMLLNSILNIDGTVISKSELIERHNIQINSQLNEISSTSMNKIKELDKKMMWKEGYWVKKINNYKPLHIHYLKKNDFKIKNPQNLTKNIQVSEKTQEELFQICMEYKFDLNSFIFGCFSSFLSFMSDRESFHLWYSDDQTLRDLDGVNNLFSRFSLIEIFYDKNNDFVDYYKSIEEQIAHTKNQKYFLWDVFYRYPELRLSNKWTPSEMRQFAYVFKMAENEANTETNLPIHHFDLSLHVNYFNGNISFAIKYLDNVYENINTFCENFSMYVENVLSPLC